MIVVFWDGVILLLMLVEEERKFFLSLDHLILFSKFRNRFTFFFKSFNFIHLSIEFIQYFIFVGMLSLKKLGQACIIFVSLGRLLLVYLILLDAEFLFLTFVFHHSIGLVDGFIIQPFYCVSAGLWRDSFDLLIIVLLIGAEDIGWFHGPSSFWA